VALVNEAAADAAERGTKKPAHETVYQTLRARILFGELAPGPAVTIQGLTEALGAGMTPVREAIRRLISDGALTFQGNRRVSVPVLSAEDVRQLIYARKSIETELSRRATTRMSGSDIDALEAIDVALGRAIDSGVVTGYMHHNDKVHTVLYDHADAPILTDIADRLWLRFGPSLRVMCGRFGTQSFPDRHKDIIDALRKRDPELAALAMERDVTQGMDQVVSGLERGN